MVSLTVHLMMAGAHVIDKTGILQKIGVHSGPPSGTHGCILWLGATWNSGKYGVMRNPFHGPDQPDRIGIHRLVYILNNLHKYPTSKLNKRNEMGEILHVSHLCHSSLCVNIDHLTLESHTVNNERQSCKTQGQCIGIHTPPCLM